MDENKRATLAVIGYEISACGMCAHAEISADQDWGTCRRYSYEHEKHTGPFRQLSINRHGHCAGFEPSQDAPVKLGKFAEFLAGAD